MSGRKTCKVLFFPTPVASKALSDFIFLGLICSFAVLTFVTLHYHISCDVIPTSHEYMKYLTLQDSFYCSCYTRQRPLYNYHNEIMIIYNIIVFSDVCACFLT